MLNKLEIQMNRIDHGFTNAHKLPTKAEIKTMPTHQTIQINVGVKFFSGSELPKKPVANTKVNIATDSNPKRLRKRFEQSHLKPGKPHILI